MNTTVTVGTGKSIHWGDNGSTLCGAGVRNGRVAPHKAVENADVTCKRCLKMIASQVEEDHAEAIELDEKRMIARAYASTPAGVVLTWEEIAELNAARDAENEARLDAVAADTVPDTAEAWKAYADRVKASRDAAENEVASMVRKLTDMAGYWERRVVQGQALPNTPWTALRAIVAEVGS